MIRDMWNIQMVRGEAECGNDYAEKRTRGGDSGSDSDFDSDFDFEDSSIFSDPMRACTLISG